MTPDIPPQAITAVYDGPGGRLDLSREDITDILEAAAPHLAAAEREACAKLAEQVDAQYPWYHAAGGIQQPVAFRPFAALLREARP